MVSSGLFSLVLSPVESFLIFVDPTKTGVYRGRGDSIDHCGGSESQGVRGARGKNDEKLSAPVGPRTTAAFRAVIGCWIAGRLEIWFGRHPAHKIIATPNTNRLFTHAFLSQKSI